MSFAAQGWAWAQTLPATQKMVLLGLADCHNGESGQCNPSMKYLALKCGLTRQSVMDQLRKLEATALIEITHGSRNDGSATSNSYHLHIGEGELLKAKLDRIDQQVVRGGQPSTLRRQLSTPRSQLTTPLEPGIEPVREPGTSSEVPAEASTSEVQPQAKPVAKVSETLTALEGVRGYPSGNFGAEGKAIKEMLGLGYSPDDILHCYKHLKEQHFFADKALNMMTLKGQIGEWKAWEGKERPKVSAPARATYGRPAIIADYKQFPEKF